MAQKKALISTEYIQLDQLIKWLGLSETGGRARWFVAVGEVTVNGNVALERRKKIYPGDIVGIEGEEYLIETGDC